jgi:AcrR family transcriptional regulator
MLNKRKLKKLFLFLKFPRFTFAPNLHEVREKILNSAAEMFLSYGFKSVTMDDIAESIGISKKTIYAHFSTKNKLVAAASLQVIQTMGCGIGAIQDKNQNPIKENYDIKHYIAQNLKGEKTSPHFQLQKYYPKVYESLKDKQYELLESCMQDNLKRGIESGYYREDINIDFISRIHFVGIMGIKDTDLFSPEKYTQPALMDHFLEYHLRAICTAKGLKTLEDLIELDEK